MYKSQNNKALPMMIGDKQAIDHSKLKVLTEEFYLEHFCF